MKKLCLFLSVAFGIFAIAPLSTEASTRTVCADGCHHATITAAKNASSAGDVISIGVTYDRSGETFPLQLGIENLSLSCSAGATIGQSSATGDNTIQLTTSSTVSGCTFSNVKLYTQSNAYYSGISITNNTVASNATGTISLSSQLGYVTISGNQNLDAINLLATSTNVTIQGNTFYGDHTEGASGILLTVGSTSTALTVSENYFESRITSLPGIQYQLVSLTGSGITFTTNTVRYIATPPTSIITSVTIGSTGGTHTIRGNKIESPLRTSGNTDYCYGLSLYPESDMVATHIYHVGNNTFRNRCDAGKLLSVSDSGKTAALAQYVSSTRNLFEAATRTTTEPAMQFGRGALTTLVGTLDSNAVYGTFSDNRGNISASTVEAGTNYYTVNPFLQTGDAVTNNDLDVAPFSLYLDIDGSGGRIGATTTTRRTTVYVDDNGTIDYSTVDATTPDSVTTTLRSGDTLSLAAGTYAGFSINSSYVTTSLAITGAGVSTIVNAGTNQNALTISSVTSTSLSGLVLQNASSTASGYTSTRMNFSFGGIDFNQASGDLNMDANTTAYILDTDINLISVAADGDSLTGATNIGTTNYHIALITTPSAESVTLLVPDSVWTNEEAFALDMGGFGAAVNAFAEDAFTVSGGVYTYQSAVVAAEDMTLIDGLTTPAISSGTTYYAGLKLTNSGGATITNVTSTANGYGIWFASGGGNRMYDSVLSSSLGYDIRQDASVTNTIDNVTFTRTSSTVSDGGAPVLVKFQARVQAFRAATPATMISGKTFTATDASAAATSLGATDADGYTAYSRLPAYTITNAGGAATTNGGYNAYTMSVSAGGGYAASSSAITLSSRNQTVTIGLVSNVAATAPSSAAAASIAATSAAFGWTDNSDDETSFTINYVTSSLGEVLGVDSGSTSTTSAGVTSATFTVYPNLQYRFRVAAVGPGGTSTYATSSLFYTLAATPGAPTLTATGRTTATVVMDANGNSTSTEFLLYNSTLSSYVTSTGASVSSPYWTGTSTWATITIADLTCNTAYSFVAVARNGDTTETSTSTAGTVTTSACATSSSGGGGGGGGVGASGATFIPTPITTPAPVTTSPIVPLPPIIVADTPTEVTSLPSGAPLPPAAPATVRTLQTDARSFGVTLAAPDQERLASFVDNGTTSETRALGSGERRALVRDALQTMGRSNVPLSDLERMARGEIPATRNLVIEREQLPRVRSTFRSLYNRDPNFRNAEENLVWNTMMYRIRFPRNLAAEREGIQDFRQAFNRTPTDPFQWAVVRALGYVL